MRTFYPLVGPRKTSSGVVSMGSFFLFFFNHKDWVSSQREMKGGADVYLTWEGGRKGASYRLLGLAPMVSPNPALAFCLKPDPVGPWEPGAGHWNVNGDM